MKQIYTVLKYRQIYDNTDKDSAKVRETYTFNADTKSIRRALPRCISAQILS